MTFIPWSLLSVRAMSFTIKQRRHLSSNKRNVMISFRYYYRGPASHSSGKTVANLDSYG